VSPRATEKKSRTQIAVTCSSIFLGVYIGSLPLVKFIGGIVWFCAMAGSESVDRNGAQRKAVGQRSGPLNHFWLFRKSSLNDWLQL